MANGVAIQSRHFNIEENDIRVTLAGHAQRGLAVATCMHFVTSQLQQFAQCLTGVRIIIGDEHGLATLSLRRSRMATPVPGLAIRWNGWGPPAGEMYGGDAGGACNGCHTAAAGNDYVLSPGLVLTPADPDAGV